ncbi:hypothetical protein FSP39_011481 [Pinctada imbricata]|uniref:2-C-methyl-D-erythritol 4-phosphate cytidylyltransferase n=1 Tax=Pinctada imbricata TaxID=66713 RepID=A0AA88YJB6_PINIB|nr:hypothetical protein FSP39_011481 [Pinctada imbricata]
MSQSNDAVDFPVFVVLPSSGTGERFGAPLPKQYQIINGMPLFLHTVSAFHRLPYVKVIAMTVSKDRREYVQSLLETHNFHKVRIAEGGVTRHRSIYNGVKALKGVCAPSDVVLIHDVVRIFADNEVVSAVAMAANETGISEKFASNKTDTVMLYIILKAAGVTRPLTSTVIGVDADGYLTESLDRSKFKASEMPQGFMYSTISGAYDKATEYDFDYGTECLHLAQKYIGSRVKVVEGPSSLWKVKYRITRNFRNYQILRFYGKIGCLYFHEYNFFVIPKLQRKMFI